MKKIILFITVLLYSINFQAQENKITTYYLIRHAEKNRTDKSDKNPNLTEKGKERASYWSEVLKNIKFDAAYSTNYNRTTQTAQPIASKNNLEIQFYNPRELYNEEFQNTTKGKKVLIVGHSNTTPMFVNKILNKEKYTQIDDNNNSNLYIVTITDNTKSDILLEIEYKKSH